MLQLFIASIVVATYDGSPSLRHPLWMAGVRSFSTLAQEIHRRPGPVRLVGIDGLAGSGKTTFAARLAQQLDGAPVVHTDDFATHEELLEWWPRLLAQVVEPLLAGRPATYRSYDWVPRSWSEPVTVPPCAVVLLEGVGAIRSAWRDRLALRIWVDAPREVRLRRVLSRGDGSAEFWQEWRAAEDAYAAAEHPQESADLVVEGNAPPLPDPDAEFIVLSAPRAAGATSA